MLITQNQVFLIAFSPGIVSMAATKKNARGNYFGHGR
jgi:hypothetical protein